MSLQYAVQYRFGGQDVTKSDSHPSCFGMFSHLSQSIPVGAVVKNVVYLSTPLLQHEFRKAWANLVKVMPTVTINGVAVPAPKVGYFTPNSKRFGNIGNEFGNSPYLRISFHKGATNGHIYPLLKMYFKHLTYPGREGMCREAIRAGESFHKNHPVLSKKPYNILVTMMAMGVSGFGIGNYQYPFGRGAIDLRAVKRYLTGTGHIQFAEVVARFDHRGNQLVLNTPFAGLKSSFEEYVSVSYLPGWEKTEPISDTQVKELKAQGIYAEVRSWGENGGTLGALCNAILKIHELMG